MTQENEKQQLCATEGCCGGHDHSHAHEGCGCGGHDHNHQGHDVVTLLLDDDTEIKCPVIDLFEMDSQEYIALLHPVDQIAMLYRFTELDEDEIEIEPIKDDAEFKAVSEVFMQMQAEYEEKE